MAPTLPFTGLAPVEAFAVEDRVAQLTWRDLPAGDLTVVVDGHGTVLGDAGRPGAADLVGLSPQRHNSVDVAVDGRVIGRHEIPTTPELPGPALTRIATISDLHLGEEGFGLLKEMRERGRHEAAYPLRCARAAIAEATAWGAELLVIKGDITELGQPGHWEQFDALLETATIPIVAIPGNHDTFAKPGALDAAEELRRRGFFPDAIQTLDLPGVRVVAADTTTPRHSWGRIGHLQESLCDAVDTDRPVLLFLHHHLETHSYPRIWPPGTPKRQGDRVLDALVEANPDLFVSSGHTHRNRARRYRSAIITEVGATKDHPGVWAGYIVHEDGVRQVVRRVADPSCIEWNDRTHAAVGGIWGKWSPGRLEQRSFTHRWSRAGVSVATEPLAATLER